MTTLRETAEHPEMQAIFAALSPDAQRTASRLIDHLDRMSLDDAERTLDLILGDASYEQTRRQLAIEADRLLAERFPEYRALSPDAQRLAVAVDQHAHDDQPTCTVIDDGARSGVQLHRYNAFDRSGAWLDFRIGEGRPCRVLVSVALDGERQGLHLIIAGHSINVDAEDIWTLDDLRRLRNDLDRLLADPRLAGALAEQH